MSATEPTGNQKLWTPWRMQYIGGGTREEGCIFCNRLAARDDVRSLILHRSNDAFVIMNLFPYNTGHVMIVPNEHVGSPELASERSLTAMTRLLPPVLRALRRAFTCHGFNVGINVGAEAGAGVAEHLHQHVVPRWTGDASFMPVLAATMVLPELIPVTYAKLRAEIANELGGGSSGLELVVLDATRQHVLIDSSGALPSVAIDQSESVWKRALARSAELGAPAMLGGWAGSPFSGDAGLALTLLSHVVGEPGPSWVSVTDFPPESAVSHAFANLAPDVNLPSR